VSPAEGFQHFGEVSINPDDRTFTVNLRDATGTSLYSKVLTAGVPVAGG
jgi:alkaline phosphatase D